MHYFFAWRWFEVRSRGDVRAGLAMLAGMMLVLAARAQTPASQTTAPAPVLTQTPAQTQPSKTTQTSTAVKSTAAKSTASKTAASKTGTKSAGPPTRYLPNRFAGRAGMYYKAVWGIDSLRVNLAESGEIVRFSWRVLDPALAKPLNEKATEPSLEDPQAGVSLVVPAMENIGKLRQESVPEAGKSYWMVFSNNGRRVKRGDHVNVVIGQFRADGLGID